MSISKETTLWCDATVKRKPCGQHTDSEPWPTKILRRMAKSRGWTRRDGKDYCPLHSKQK